MVLLVKELGAWWTIRFVRSISFLLYLSPISASRSPHILHHAPPRQENQLLRQHFTDRHPRLLPRPRNQRIRSVQQAHLWQSAGVELRSGIDSDAPGYRRAVFRGATAPPEAGDELAGVRGSTSSRSATENCRGAEVVESMSVASCLPPSPLSACWPA